MPSLEEQKERARQKLEQESPNFFEQMTNPYIQAAKSFNVGLAQMLGLPGLAATGLRGVMGYEDESAFPTGSEVQKAMADVGMTYEPGESPDTLFARFMENLGASSLPIGGFAAKGIRTVTPYAIELAAAAGGAAGGKAVQTTEWGQKNPQLARAAGELTGGLGAGIVAQSPSALGRLGKSIITEGPPGVRALKAPMRGKWARRRAVKSLSEQAEDPKQAGQILKQGIKAPEETGLTAAQKTGDPGIMRLRRRVEAEIPEEAQFGTQQISDATQELKTMTISSEEGAGNVQVFLDDILQRRGEAARKALQKAKQAKNPEVYNRLARQKIEQAYNEARDLETKIWQELPTEGAIDPDNLKQVYSEELENITAGGDIAEIDRFARKKLGSINQEGELTGGVLFGKEKKTVTPKELHQFYSRLGRRVRERSVQAGQTNKIRILNRLRNAALNDLDTVEAGTEYRKAINFSRDLNERFTTGDLGKVLGFERGLSSPEAMTLDELLGAGGQQAYERVQQVLKASPGVEDDIKNFIRSRFYMMATNENNQRIAAKSGTKFLKQNRQLLDAFPDLKKELNSAVSKQKRVDMLKGADQIEDISPISKQKAAASLFLDREDPNDAIRAILRKEGRPGMNKTRYLKELVQMVRKDPTGKAKKGLKNAISSELLDVSKIKTDEEAFISGKTFLRRLDTLEEPLKKSGALSNEEINRLRKIGQAFKKIEIQRVSGEAKSITTDVPGQGLEVLGRIMGAHVSRLIPGGGGAGVGLQEAQIGSSFGKKLINSLTNDEARNLLIRATRDEKLMDDLLTDVRKLKKNKQEDLVKRIIKKGKEIGGTSVRKTKEGIKQKQVPVAAVAPPMVSAGRETEEESLKQRIKEKLNR